MKLIGFTLALSALVVQAESAVTVTKPASHIRKSTCPKNDGLNLLKPDPVTQLPPPAAGSAIMNELNNGDTKFPGWTFATGGKLNGTIKILRYESKFVGDHLSGCVMKLEYIKGPGDPANIQFVQMISTDRPLNGAKSPYIDPNPSDDPAGSPMPFYYTAAEMPGNTTPTGIKFYDFPKRKHPPTSAVDWIGDLYIASWDGAKGVTLHDGIRYGFMAGCTKPVPVVVAVGVEKETIHITPGDLLHVKPVTLMYSPADALSPIFIPNDPALIGTHLLVQAMVTDNEDVADPIKMSNPLDVTIGGDTDAFEPGSGAEMVLYYDAVIGGTIDMRLLVESSTSQSHDEDTDGKEDETADPDDE